MKQITIYKLLPLLRPGWVAKGAHGWAWFGLKPIPHNDWGCYIPDRKLKQRPGWISPINTMDALEYNHIADASKKVADIKK